MTPTHSYAEEQPFLLPGKTLLIQNLAKIALEHLGKNQRDYLLVEQNNFHQTNNLRCWPHLRIVSVGKNATQKAPEFNRLPNRSTLFDFFDIESKGLTEGHPPGPEPD